MPCFSTTLRAGDQLWCSTCDAPVPRAYLTPVKIISTVGGGLFAGHVLVEALSGPAMGLRWYARAADCDTSLGALYNRARPEVETTIGVSSEGLVITDTWDQVPERTDEAADSSGSIVQEATL